MPVTAPIIRNLADVRQIEAQPYAQFMPFESVFDAIQAVADAHPARPALTYLSQVGESPQSKTWSHQSFAAEVRRAARLFQALANGEEARIAMLLPAIPQAYFTLWGAETAGVVLPINYLLEGDHIADLLQAGRINLLVTLGPHPELDIWSKVSKLPSQCPLLKCVLAVGGAPGAQDFDEALGRQSDARFDNRPSQNPNTLAALFHTGGTTGKPKLAQHTHLNQLHAAWGAACMYGASPEDVILNGFPLFHVAGAFVYGLSILLAGGEVVLPTVLGMRNPAFMKDYWRVVERQSVTLLATVPTVISTLLNVPLKGENLSRVRCLLTGGSPLPAELADSFEQQFGIGVRNILGMTECGGVIAIEPAFSARVPGSAGLPLPFTSVTVVDDADASSGLSAEGILCVTGPNVGPGYTDTARNAGVFTVNGALISGDIGHVDGAGRVYVTGRAKDLIIRSSHNIDPVVIEDALLKHPDVLMAAAVGAPDEYAGEIPVAFVSLKPGSTVTADELSLFANKHIPERPACPKSISLMAMLPMTAIGKLFKPALRALAIQSVIEDRVQKIAAQGSVRVEVSMEGASPVVRLFTASDPAREAALKKAMSGFALKYDVVATDSTRQ